MTTPDDPWQPYPQRPHAGQSQQGWEPYYQQNAPVPYEPQGPYPPQQYPRHSYPPQQYPRHSYSPQPPRRHGRLDSEEVVLAAPMSFTGSAERLWKLTRSAPANVWASTAVYTGVVLLVAVAWAAVFFWYCMFGLWLVPYRLIRRGQRKRRREDLRHREMLTMMHQMGQQQRGSHRMMPPGAY